VADEHQHQGVIGFDGFDQAVKGGANLFAGGRHQGGDVGVAGPLEAGVDIGGPHLEALIVIGLAAKPEMVT